MTINYLCLAVPFFTGLMLLEYFLAKRQGKDFFELHGSIANVSIGIAERLADVMIAGSFFYVYDYLQRHFGLFDIKGGIFWWILLFLFTDLLWYWYHRLAHEVNVLWMAHVVHHQSDEFNFTVSARITVLQAVIRTAFWSVLSLIGFPAEMITALLLLHGLYPFFIHTRLIGKLGVLEYVLVTPSHHRVHHASNERYLDKNYGDVLIIWDKLFGTFQKEEEAPVYGLTKPLNTYSFLWQHFHFAIEMWLAVKAERSWWKRLKIVFGRPSAVDPELRGRAEALFGVKRNGDVITKPLNKYVVVQMIVLLVSLFFFIAFEHYSSPLVKTVFAILTVITLINCGAIMEQKRWVFQLEAGRLFLIFLLPFYSPAFFAVKLALLVISIGVFLVCYPYAKTKYLQYVYK